jgi:hypothetical protein
LYAAPLFEEERNCCRTALRENPFDPRLFHRTCAPAALASDYHPIDVRKL